jgi:hypothetical protein
MVGHPDREQQPGIVIEFTVSRFRLLLFFWSAGWNGNLRIEQRSVGTLWESRESITHDRLYKYHQIFLRHLMSSEQRLLSWVRASKALDAHLESRLFLLSLVNPVYLTNEAILQLVNPGTLPSPACTMSLYYMNTTIKGSSTPGCGW